MLKQRLLMAASHSSIPVSTGELYSWGYNGSGQTAQNLTSGNVYGPTLAYGPTTGWSKISGQYFLAGSGGEPDGFVTAIKTDGTLWGWGSNSGSGIGLGPQGSVTQVSIPTQVGSDTNWVTLSQGYYGGLAIKSDGTLWCWGTDIYGQLGQGGTAGIYTVPTQVGSGTDWTKVFTNGRTTFVIDTSDHLWSVGGVVTDNDGNGGTTTPTITQIGTDTWSQICVIENYFACTDYVGFSIGLQTNGTIWSAGNNLSGATAQGTTSGTTSPWTQIGSDSDWVFVNAVISEERVSGSYYYGAAFAIKSDGTLWGWGNSINNGQGTGTVISTPTQIGSATNWLMLSSGNIPGSQATSQGLADIGYTVGLQSNGTIWSWGGNGSGQAGLPSGTATAPSPVQIGSDTNWTYVAACGSNNPSGDGCGFALK